MMDKALVLGGTRFFGKRVVEKLLEDGIEVTLATRGTGGNPFGTRVHHLKVDRFDRGSMEKNFQDGEWDVIIDQICFSPDDAFDAVEIFKDRTERYIFTSTLSVYEMNGKAEKVEEDFDPTSYPVEFGRKEQFTYGEGKRLAEAVFAQHAPFPVVMIRPPIVVGTDDYTKRLQFHMERIKGKVPIGLDAPGAELSFVDAEELASFIHWSATQSFDGPVNTSSPDHMTLDRMLRDMHKVLGTGEVIVKPSQETETASPMNFPTSFYQNSNRATTLGYSFSPMSDWFSGLIQKLDDHSEN
ncbi:NAD-dependent epimerase/dehydratase family protein [Salisediminibacterium beveridgei]|uniref:Isoflavone reductase n=1 Tax=Salisediminibacterium beveridgei TaxID=632773 RepID=A0A1D7QXW7_9BACI|nr:NAD-dependent epimerase/dehydratase family protein [Salisediminibacterium beveridgei]AOM83808.1 Isoflavone reductase [Salisediminibacterium beveridgei]